MKLLYLTILITLLCSCSERKENEYLDEAHKLEGKGKYQQAINLLDEAIEIYPESIKLKLDRAADKSALGKHEEAIKDYKSVLQIDSRNILATYNIGLNYRWLNKLELSIEHFNNALDLLGGNGIYILASGDPNYLEVSEITFERGISLMDTKESNNLNPAILDFQNCINDNYKVSECLNNIGCMLYWINNDKEACDHFIRAAKLGNKDAKENLENLCND